MDFELNEDQQAILSSVQRLLELHAGPARAVELQRADRYDDVLHASLLESGFFSIARDLAVGEKLASLEAALIVEAIARAGGVVACGAQLLVAAALTNETLAGPVALCTHRELLQRTPVRFAAHAKTLLLVDDNEIFTIALGSAQRSAVRTSFGYPMGRIEQPEALPAGTAIGSAAVAQNWWRLALAAEATGTMEAALAHTVEYLKQRRQFGRPIGSFQAVQHRLAHCAIQVEASRWLTREAAYHGAPAQASAAAAAFALQAADLLFTETHQLSGAIGFTHEFDLHVWSMRLMALRQELNGVGGARRALVQARWKPA